MSDELHRALVRGPQGAAELQRVLSVSKSTLQRALHRARDRILTAGRARATRYAARRAIDGVSTPIPVYEADPSGAFRHALTLHPVEPFGFYAEGHVADVDSGFTGLGVDEPELPWFLADTRPQGFLGRVWARGHGDQGYPIDPDRWSADQVLRFLTHYGVDLVGSFVVGAFARDLVEHGRLDAPRGLVGGPSEREDYPDLAHQALTDASWGSSPGGEQPKFAVRGRIVKFSPRSDEPSGRRWADLLAVEHLAHEVLRESGVDAARSAIVDAGGRRFLEVERFDRHGPRGRSGVVSLAALDRTGVARELRRWSLGTALLVGQGQLEPADQQQVEWLEAFGDWIANTDMHPGNLSFRMRGTRLVGLAPVYDMLPMAFAPRHGERPSDDDRVPAERDRSPASAVEAARALWERVAASPDISDEFKRIADRRARSTTPGHSRLGPIRSG